MRKRVAVFISLLAGINLFISTNTFAETAYPVSLIDAAGQKVTLKSKPRRIVVVGRTFFVPLHMIHMFPEGERALVGYEKRGENQEGFLSLINPDVQSLVKLAPEPGPEQLAALKPDLVLSKGSTVGPLHRSLASLNIPVMYLGVENPEQFLNDIKNLGIILDERQRSQEIISYYTEWLKKIDDNVSSIPQANKPDVLVLRYDRRSGAASVRVPARSWIQTIQVQRSGGNPVWINQFGASDNWQITGFEQIANWNPDKIFMIVWHRNNVDRVMASLRTDSKWRLLKAVSSNEFYRYPEDIYGWDTPDPRWILGMMWMAKRTHPKLFPELDLGKEVVQFFKSLFEIDTSVIEKEILPLLNLTPVR